MIARRAVLATAFVFLAFPALAEESPVFVVSGIAIRGYDPVAYFTENKPVKGRDDIQLRWMGATWRFATKANREIFERMPQKYAPQYGGYCAYAASQGEVAASDPFAFAIYEGRLYLSASQSVGKAWAKDKPGYIAAADKAWPQLLRR